VRILLRLADNPLAFQPLWQPPPLRVQPKKHEKNVGQIPIIGSGDAICIAKTLCFPLVSVSRPHPCPDRCQSKLFD
jgi:hypothetical protein